MTVVVPAALEPPAALDRLITGALADVSFGEAQRVTVIVSDPTRKEPREALLAAILNLVSSETRVTLAIATGTHGPCRIDDLGLSQRSLARVHDIINHDGHSNADLADVGTTSRGTPVRVHRCLLDSELVIATGCIRPHYFAGFGAGAKALFPGLGQATAIRVNHRFKTEPMSRAGIVDGNPCREDIEEAVAMILTKKFLINGIADPDDRIQAVVAGGQVGSDTRSIDDVFREGVALARPLFTVRAPRAPLVIASDALPVTTSLYQAAKIAAAVAPLVEPGGTLALVAECPEGVGPLETVNEAIFRIGVLPRLAPDVRLVLISGLDRSVVDQTLLRHAASLDSVLADVPPTAPITVVPHASKLICEAAS